MNPNEQTAKNIAGYATSSAENKSDNNHKKVGPIIATLIIVLVLIIAALYLFASRIEQQNTPTDTTNVTAIDTVAGDVSETATATQSVQMITNASDDPQLIQNDLDNSTNGLESQNF